MMQKRLWVLVCCMLALAASAMAQSTAPAAVSTAPSTSASLPELEPLIEKLADPDWKVRSAAQDAIVAFGDDAVPRLQQLQSTSPDAEVRIAAENMLARIAESRLTGATLITLHLKDVEPNQAFEALEAQIKAELRIWPEGLWQHHKPGRVTIDATRRPFWDVLKELCEKTLVTPREMGSSEPLTLMQGSDDHMYGPRAISGAFMVVANSATESRALRYGRPIEPQRHNNTSLMLMITCFAEPKLRILARSQTPLIEEAVDNDGRSLLADGPRQPESEMAHAQERVFSFHLGLRATGENSHTLARLKGRFRALIESRSEKLVIDDIMNARGLVKDVAGRRVIVSEVTESERQYGVKLTIVRRRRDIDERRPAWQDNLQPNEVVLQDVSGKPLRAAGYSGGGSSEKLEYELSFSRDRDGGPPARLLWELPVEAKEIVVPFEFKDLPLP